MPFLFWIDIIGLVISIFITGALTLLVVGLDPRNKVNRSFGYFTGAMTIWTAAGLCLRMSLWLEPVIQNGIQLPSSHLWLFIASISIASMCLLSLMFAATYLDRRTRSVNWAIAFGLVIIVLLILRSIVEPGATISGAMLDSHGLVTRDMSVSGQIALGIFILYTIWAVTIFYRDRHRTETNYLAAGVFILFLGLACRSFVSLPFPFQSFSNALCALMLGYAVIRKQIFNPLKVRNIQLGEEIKERKRTEAALRKFEHIVSSSYDMLAFIDRSYVYQTVNETYAKAHGKTIQDIVGTTVSDLCGETIFDAQIKNGLDQCLAGARISYQAFYDFKGLGRRFMDVIYSPHHEPSGLVSGVVVTSRDLTDRWQSAEALREKQETINAIIDTSQDWIWAIDNEGFHTFSNKAVEVILGIPLERVIGHKLHNLLHPEDKEMIDASWNDWLNKKTGWKNIVFRWLHQDGKYRYLESSSVPYFDSDERLLGFRGVDRDITERIIIEEEKTKLEKLLIQSQKMEAMGTIAAGIAHDFNNILGAIFGYAQLLGLEITGNNKVNDYIKGLLESSHRAKNLVAQILAFSRPTTSEKIAVDISIVVKDALKLIRSSLPANIEIRQEYAPNLGIITADPNQIHRIILNLCTNSFHAMNGKVGTIDIGLTPVVIKNEDSAFYKSMLPGRYVRLTVTDTGHGMDSATLEHIFEPYFTTKEVGVGTGLGLATVHNIVEDHGGEIKVYSEPGAGTTFQIFFPCVYNPIVKESQRVESFATGKESILFIDDEKILVDIGHMMLTKLGYKVDCRTNPYEALETFKVNPQKYNLVISDMSMPKMTGDKLAKEMLKIRPNIPVIICTGFSNVMDQEKAYHMGIKGFLMKPVTISELSKSIRTALDQ